jgi:hypothetical protein
LQPNLLGIIYRQQLVDALLMLIVARVAEFSDLP